MTRSIQPLICMAFLGCTMAPALAREWKDVTGLYTLEADLIGFDGEMVVLQRADKELGSCPINKLCDEDREYLKSKEALEIHSSNIEKTQTWTMETGLKVIGRIADYDRRELTIQRRKGKIVVNDQPFDELPEVYQTMLPSIVAHLESKAIPNKQAFDLWVMSLRGQPATFTLDGVIFELENGTEYAVPFFLFAENDQLLLQSGWEAWLKDHGQQPAATPQSTPQTTSPSQEERDEHAFQLQSLASAYQQNQEVDRQIAVMNLNMQAIQSGLTSAWEVTLYPGRGNPYPPRWVVTMGRNSEVATQIALQQNPGFIPGPVRKVSR